MTGLRNFLSSCGTIGRAARSRCPAWNPSYFRGGPSGRDGSGRPVRHVALLTDTTEMRRASERQHILMRELAHRGKNLLAVIQSIASRSMSGNTTLAEARSAFQGRLQALARTYGSLTDEAFAGVALHNLIKGEISAFSNRATLTGPDIKLTARAAQTLSLVIHELATNAAKYGALSVAGGQVEIVWRTAAGTAVQGEPNSQRFQFQWREIGGPPARRPSARGFGTTLVTAVAGAEFRCTPEVDYAEAGLTYRLDAPLSNVGSVVHHSPMRSRLQHPALQTLYDSWRDNRGGSGLSAAGPELEHLKKSGYLTRVEVDCREDLRVVSRGAALQENLGRSLGNLDGDTEQPEQFGEAYKKCAREQRPNYEFARFDFGDGDPVTFERLLVPYKDETTGDTVVIGIAAFSGTRKTAA